MSANAWRARRANRTQHRDDLAARDFRDVAPDDRRKARMWSQCPWYRGVGSCATGCWEEPACANLGPWRYWD